MNIYEAIPMITSEIGAIAKDKINEAQKFKYRGIDQVMNALNHLLAKYKVTIAPETSVYSREERITKTGGTMFLTILNVKYRIYAEDGTFIEAAMTGEAQDSGDKGTNKAMAIAYKYLCFQLFCIPTEEMKDPDGETMPDTVKKLPKIDLRAVQSDVKQMIYPKGDDGEPDGFMFDLKDQFMKRWGFQKTSQMNPGEWVELQKFLLENVPLPFDEFGK